MGARTTSGPAGGDYDLSNLVGSFIDVVERVVARPAEFFSGIPRRGNYWPPLLFALICAHRGKGRVRKGKISTGRIV